MKVYFRPEDGMFAQAKHFKGLDEEVMLEEYGFVLLKSKNGTPLKTENYCLYRRFNDELGTWEPEYASRDGKAKRKNLPRRGWELVKEIDGQLPEELSVTGE